MGACSRGIRDCGLRSSVSARSQGWSIDTQRRLALHAIVLLKHYPALVVAYLVGLGGWLVASRLVPWVWPREPVEGFAHPWKEFGIAMVGAIGILAMGQLWT